MQESSWHFNEDGTVLRSEGRFNVQGKCMEAMSLETLLEAAKYVEYTTQAKARGKSLITDYF